MFARQQLRTCSKGPCACKKALRFLQLRFSGELSSLSGRHLTAVRNWQAPLYATWR